MKKSRVRKKPADRGPVGSSGEVFYPYTGQNVTAFFSRHESVRIAYLKIERSIDDVGHHICEMVLHAGEERLFLQGIRFRENRFRYPPHLQAVPGHVKQTFEQEVIRRLLQTRVIESPLLDETLAYCGERVVPGTAPFHAYWMHARRYGFAAVRCRRKRVLDAGCGSGYGTRILGMEGTECLGVDKDPEAVRLADSLFAAPGVRFAVADVTRLEGIVDHAFSAVVALELLEHLPPETVPAFLEAVRRVLAPQGTFVVSVANRAYREKEENPFHLSEMDYGEFRELLEAWFPSARIETFGQDVWGGTWDLERECRIEPIRSATPHHVYVGVAELSG
jgi:SAM-dependent methyltransferase